MTSVLTMEEVCLKADKSTVHECETYKGRGVKKPENFADFISECSHGPPPSPSLAPMRHYSPHVTLGHKDAHVGD